MTTTPMDGFALAFVCPACLAGFPGAADQHPEDPLVFGMRAVPVHLHCVDDMVLDESYDLIDAGDGTYYLLCPHERETSRPFRPKNCCQLTGSEDCWDCAPATEPD